MVDWETGLFAGDAFEKLLTEEVTRASTGEFLFSVIACVPYQLPGEQQKDVVQVAAGCIRELLRKDDLAGRLSDEVLAIGLPDTSVDEARVVAHRLKSDLGLRTAHWRATKWEAGVAALPDDGETGVDLIRAAIEHAKESHR
jgi:GGDEF domain-containing protein